ncbi:hypothetical protein [Lonsdalea quercina]|uniref:hypothetical protein n=1 Tax=Lonsdalea quercina TaxID=71657 RepID=UPI003977148C
MSDELKQFYRELWVWVQDGCPDHAVFIKTHAICWNLDQWSGYRMPLTRENNDLLLDVFGNSFFPFNSEGAWEFARERAEGGFYQNPKRLAFIEEHAK